MDYVLQGIFEAILSINRQGKGNIIFFYDSLLIPPYSFSANSIIYAGRAS